MRTTLPKKELIALADTVRAMRGTDSQLSFIQEEKLAEFCASRNPRFSKQRWLDYVHGEAGPNGGRTRRRS